MGLQEVSAPIECLRRAEAAYRRLVILRETYLRLLRLAVSVTTESAAGSVPSGVRPLAFILSALIGVSLQDGARAQPGVSFMSAASDGSVLVMSIVNGETAQGSPVRGELLAIATGDNRVLWRQPQQGLVQVLAVSPDKAAVAVGYHGSGNTADGIVLLSMTTGRQVGSVPDNDAAPFPSERHLSKLRHRSGRSRLFGGRECTLRGF